MIWEHRFLLDQDSSPPSGGAPASSGSPAPASPQGGATPPEGAGDASSGAPVEVTESPPAGGHDPFDGMESNDYEDVIDLGMQEAPTDDGSGEAEAALAPSGEGEPKPATAAQAAPQAAVPPTPQGATDGNAQQSPRSQLDTALDGFKNNQAALSDWASTNLFKLSQADAEALETDVVGTIPKLMGRVYAQMANSTVNLIKSLVPEMINSGVTAQQARTARATEALNEFYQTNPHLSADKHGGAVDKWARVFRQANPQASRKDAIAFVGRAVSAEFGLSPGAQASPTARRAVPFAPARQGGRAPPSAKGPHDPYAGMEDDDYN